MDWSGQLYVWMKLTERDWMHFNAIFLSDSNPLEQTDYRDAFIEAKKQNAFIFWNHPGE